jgi:cell division protein FtsI (penicillin-binding protein 3)
MIRTPLRPLTRVLQARQNGENPDQIERDNLRLRHESQRDKMRDQSGHKRAVCSPARNG